MRPGPVAALSPGQWPLEREQQTPASLALALGAALIVFKLAIILTDDIKMGLSNNEPFLAFNCNQDTFSSDNYFPPAVSPV